MITAHIFQYGDSQAVQLPSGFEFSSEEIAIRREGGAVILEPITPVSWPADFFEGIRIDDPAFSRPAQGDVPLAPVVE